MSTVLLSYIVFIFSVNLHLHTFVNDYTEYICLAKLDFYFFICITTNQIDFSGP
jgi:hypothetical protein